MKNLILSTVVCTILLVSVAESTKFENCKDIDSVESFHALYHCSKDLCYFKMNEKYSFDYAVTLKSPKQQAWIDQTVTFLEPNTLKSYSYSKRLCEHSDFYANHSELCTPHRKDFVIDNKNKFDLEPKTFEKFTPNEYIDVIVTYHVDKEDFACFRFKAFVYDSDCNVAGLKAEIDQEINNMKIMEQLRITPEPMKKIIEEKAVQLKKLKLEQIAAEKIDLPYRCNKYTELKNSLEMFQLNTVTSLGDYIAKFNELDYQMIEFKLQLEQFVASTIDTYEFEFFDH